MNRLIGRSVAGAVVTAMAAVASDALSAGVLPPALARHPPASIASTTSRDKSLEERRHKNPLKRTVIEKQILLGNNQGLRGGKLSAVSVSRSAQRWDVSLLGRNVLTLHQPRLFRLGALDENGVITLHAV